MSTVNATTREAALELAQELERRAKTARDVLVPAKHIELKVACAVHLGETTDSCPCLLSEAKGTVAAALPLAAVGATGARMLQGFTKTAHSQTAELAGIPRQYYDRMLGAAPELLCRNVNHWLASDGRTRLLRTLDGNIRANLSDRYRSLDSYDLFFAVTQTGNEVGAEISRYTLTDDRFEMRLIHPEWRETLDYRDGRGHRGGASGESTFVPGVFVANSETGRGGLSVRPFLLDLVCMNGAIGEKSMAAIHLGERLQANELGAVLSTETRSAKDRALWLEVRDLVRAVFDRERFEILVEQMRGAVATDLEKPIETVNAVAAKLDFSDEDRQAILNELISPSHGRDPGRTVFGLLSAITERAKTYAETDADRHTELQEAAGRLLREPELVRVR